MKKSSYLLSLGVLIAISNGCDSNHSAAMNNRNSAIVQQTVNTNTNAKSENSQNSEKFVESNSSESNSPVQTNQNEIIAASEKTVESFYKALKERNRKEALKFAKPKVVRQLFRDKKSKLNWRFIDCEEPKKLFENSK